MWLAQSEMVARTPGIPGSLPARRSRNDWPGHVDIVVAALDEIHRHVERVVDPALEAHARLERPRQHAGAIIVGVAPDFRAERQKAVGLAVGERRVGEQRRRNRLQRQRHAQLLDHVGFRGEVEIGLHRAGAIHHVEAERADLRHIGGHDLVAALGHFRHVGARSRSASCRGRESRCAAAAPLRAPAPDAPSARSTSGARSRPARPTARTGRRARAKSRRRRSRRTGR